MTSYDMWIPHKNPPFFSRETFILEKKFMEFKCLLLVWPLFHTFFVSTSVQEVWGPVNRNGGASAC